MLLISFNLHVALLSKYIFFMGKLDQTEQNYHLSTIKGFVLLDLFWWTKPYTKDKIQGILTGPSSKSTYPLMWLKYSMEYDSTFEMAQIMNAGIQD